MKNKYTPELRKQAVEELARCIKAYYELDETKKIDLQKDEDVMKHVGWRFMFQIVFRQENMPAVMKQIVVNEKGNALGKQLKQCYGRCGEVNHWVYGDLQSDGNMNDEHWATIIRQAVAKCRKDMGVQ